MEKKSYKKWLLLVTGGIASGKTTLSLNIARNAANFIKTDAMPGERNAPGVICLDKDSLCPLSDVIAPDRKSERFKELVRTPEYIITENYAAENLAYVDLAIINAPYTGELREEANGGSDRLKGLADTLHEKGIGLFVVCIDIDGNTAEKQRLSRNNLRDINMAGAYADGAKDVYTVPDLSASENIDRYFVYRHSHAAEDFYALINELKALFGCDIPGGIMPFEIIKT